MRRMPFHPILTALSICLSMASVSARSGCDAVLGPATPTTNFKVKRDYVIDKETGLEWARCAYGMAPAADGHRCVGSPRTLMLPRHTGTVVPAPEPLPSGSGWRFPTPHELSTILDGRCFQPAINDEVFPNTPVGRYWAVERHAPLKKSGDLMRHYGDFAAGAIGSDENWTELYARFVRGPVLRE